MSVDLDALLREVAGLHVVVAGDALLDVFVNGTTRGLCREAPVPVVAVQDRHDCPGGAANTAANVAALGGQPRFVSSVGGDKAGVRMRETLAAASVPVTEVSTATGATVVKWRVMAGGHVLLRLDQGTEGVRPGDATAAALARAAPGASALVISDYEYGVMEAVAPVHDLTPVVVVDAKHPDRYRAWRPTAATPNYAEATRLLGLPALDRDDERVAQLFDRGTDLLDATGARLVAVTLGSAGALMFEAGRPPHRARAVEATAHDVIGAGDVFAAALSMALGRGADAPVAVEFATQAGAAAASASIGVTARCPRHALASKLDATDKVLRHEELPEWAAARRRAGERIVFTNGCFDLLHEGHVAFLSQAKALGAKLIVAVNDDESVRGLKGPGRPVTALAGRLRVLGALTCVDHVVPFSGPSPAGLIEAVLPDIYVKGGDYQVADLPELPMLQRHGIAVRILDYLADRSTSHIIEQVRLQG